MREEELPVTSGVKLVENSHNDFGGGAEEFKKEEEHREKHTEQHTEQHRNEQEHTE